MKNKSFRHFCLFCFFKSWLRCSSIVWFRKIDVGTTLRWWDY